MLTFLFLTQAELLPTTGPLHSLCSLPEGAAPRALPGRSVQHSAPSDALPAPSPVSFMLPRLYLKSPRSPVVHLSPLVSSLPPEQHRPEEQSGGPRNVLPRAQNGRPQRHVATELWKWG